MNEQLCKCGGKPVVKDGLCAKCEWQRRKSLPGYAAYAERSRERSKARYASNRDERRALGRERGKLPEVKAAKKKYMREWYARTILVKDCFS